MTTCKVILLLVVAPVIVCATVVPSTAFDPDDEVGCFTPETLDLMLEEHRRNAAKYGPAVAGCFYLRMTLLAESADETIVREGMSPGGKVVCASRNEIQHELRMCRLEAASSTHKQGGMGHVMRYRVGLRGSMRSACFGNHPCCRLRSNGMRALRRCFRARCWKWNCR